MTRKLVVTRKLFGATEKAWRRADMGVARLFPWP